VALRADCEQLVALAVERHGRLDVLVNNAVLAGAHSKPLLSTSDGDWDAMMAVNLRGPFMLCQAVVRQIAVEHGRDGIICNAVAPGKILTGAPGDLAADEASAAYVRSRTPFARLGEPGDVAAAVAFLASDQASCISGVNLLVDGGWMAY